jgi:hypothetical protein
VTADGGPGVPSRMRERFRAAGAQIEWRPVAGKRKSAARIAHLFQEEARVEAADGAGGRRVIVDSGPVGALVILLEAEEHGAPREVVALNTGREPEYPQGALVAVWGRTPAPPHDGPVGVGDLVDLARYALA